MEFNNRIKMLRQERGLSKTEIGKRFGVSRRAVYAWENGDKYPEIPRLIQLAQFYNVSVDCLLCLTDEI